MKIKIPESLKLEHEELHKQLAETSKMSGKIGEAAKLLAEILYPHFIAEEEFAIPPLGVLQQLAVGDLSFDILKVLDMTTKLKTLLPKMLDEHKAINAALDKLIDLAKNEDKVDVIEFSEKLKLHAKVEEEVTYPASLLIGEYLKLKL